MRPLLPFVACLALLASAAEAAVPARGGSAAPEKSRDPVEVARVELSLPAAAELAAEDAARAAAGEPYRFALPEAVALTPANAGTWDALPDGRRRWRLRVTVPGARSLNLGFVRFGLPPSGRLALHPADRPEDGLVFDADDVAPHGELWTPLLRTDDLVVELVVAPAEAPRVDLELGAINRGYRGFVDRAAGKAGSCNVDVACPEADDWRHEVAAVAVYSVLGSLKCTGTLVNNTARDGRPLFLTASHCRVTDAYAASVTVYWNFESPLCGQQGGGTLDDSQSGTTLRADWGGTGSGDMTLLELDDVPPAGYGAVYAGWNRRDVLPSSSVTIHHPATDEKSISFDDDPPTITSWGTDPSPGDGTHLRIGAWDLGTTEIGSSGAPLFDQDHLVVGQLHGGFASCEYPLEPDWYGRLQAAWEGGGTADTRLRDWLDPGDTGAETVAALVPEVAALSVQPTGPREFLGPRGGPFDPAELIWTVTNSGTLDLDWTVAASADWLVLSPAGGTLAPGAQATVTALPAAEAAERGFGRHVATVAFTNAGGGPGDLEVDVALHVLPFGPRLVGVVPNPSRGPADIVFEVDRAMSVRLRVFDLRGRRLADLGRVDAEVGTNVVRWDGFTDEGRNAPRGIYVLEAEGGGHRDLVKFAQVN